MTKLATNWDALLASSPLNRQAARDASAKGGAFVPRGLKISPGCAHFETPPPMKAIPSAVIAAGHDLTGMTIGRLTVLGLAATENRNRAKAAWVVRCKCGRYEHRTARGWRILIATPERARCVECDYLARLRSGDAGIEFPKINVRSAA